MIEAKLPMVRKAAIAVRDKYKIPVGQGLALEFYTEYKGELVYDYQSGLIKGVVFANEADETMFRLRFG